MPYEAELELSGEAVESSDATVLGAREPALPDDATGSFSSIASVPSARLTQR